jgi:cytidylate kinase
MLHTPDRVVEALARLHHYAETQHPVSQVPPLSVAISRQSGSRGSSIAQVVGARLGWPVYDHELLTRIAEEKGLSARLLEHLDERCHTWMEKILSSFSTESNDLDAVYLKHLVQMLMSLGNVGHCIIVGRGATHVLPIESTLRVRVVAPHAFRVSETVQRKGMTKIEAERWVDKTDADRKCFVRAYFFKDAADPLNYDLVLNSSRFSIDDCAEMIVEAVKVRELNALAASAQRKTA